MTIIEAIKTVLKDNSTGLTAYQIYEEIVRQNLYTFKGKKVEGTYVFDPEAKTITIQAGRLKVKTVAHVVTLGSNMSFVFDADKIFSVVKTITGVTSGLNASASTINKLLEEFDGMMVGFELKKQ